MMARPQRAPTAYPTSPPIPAPRIDAASTPAMLSWPWLARTEAPATTVPPMAGTPAQPIATRTKTTT